MPEVYTDKQASESLADMILSLDETGRASALDILFPVDLSEADKEALKLCDEILDE